MKMKRNSLSERSCYQDRGLQPKLSHRRGNVHVVPLWSQRSSPESSEAGRDVPAPLSCPHPIQRLAFIVPIEHCRPSIKRASQTHTRAGTHGWEPCPHPRRARGRTHTQRHTHKLCTLGGGPRLRNPEIWTHCPGHIRAAWARSAHYQLPLVSNKVL